MLGSYLSGNVSTYLTTGMQEVSSEIKLCIAVLAVLVIVFGYLSAMYSGRYKTSLAMFKTQRYKLPLDIAVEDADMASAKFVDKVKTEAGIWAMSWALSRMFLLGFVISLGCLLYLTTVIL